MNAQELCEALAKHGIKASAEASRIRISVTEARKLVQKLGEAS